MPRRDYTDDEDDQPIDVKIYRSTTEQIIPQISNDEIRNQIIKARTSLNLTPLQLNQKCKFQFKYTIRDIESGKSIPTLTEKRAISIALGIDLK
jgi:ribosome-binding protein aMBF1 (putative translation factor)